ncbi:MAG TPA: TRAP transporter small permease subunit [Burkholderiaceae bacterium]|nr:TRAP transporter small permease subunit [Burkholderiaceae bacterium]
MLERFRAGYGRALEVVVIVLMVALAAEVVLGVVFRTVGHSLAWYDEVASILLAWLTFYGSALASCKRAHIGCPEVVEQLAPRPRHAVAVLAQLLVIAFFALLGYVGAMVLPVLATDTLVSLPAVPVSAVQSVIPISAALILVAEGMTLADLLRNGPATGASALADGLH